MFTRPLVLEMLQSLASDEEPTGVVGFFAHDGDIRTFYELFGIDADTVPPSEAQALWKCLNSIEREYVDAIRDYLWQLEDYEQACNMRLWNSQRLSH